MLISWNWLFIKKSHSYSLVHNFHTFLMRYLDKFPHFPFAAKHSIISCLCNVRRLFPCSRSLSFCFPIYKPLLDYTTSRLHNAALQSMIDFKTRYSVELPYASVSSAAATTNFAHANSQIDARSVRDRSPHAQSQLRAGQCQLIMDSLMSFIELLDGFSICSFGWWWRVGYHKNRSFRSTAVRSSQFYDRN